MRISRYIAVTMVLLTLLVGQGGAQVPPNCALDSLPDPTRQVLRCAGSLIIEIDAATELGFVDGDDGLPRTVTIEKGRVLIEVEPGSAAPQIRTPHAIAAVRGTIYAVEVGAESTAVFVLRGQVDVRKPDSEGSVVLGPGEGVDVTPALPLEVKTWAETRVRSLLAHFGR